ncbi:SMEK 2, suppressor of mek1 (Dictyostelium) [Dermatophagoides farinae]|uniref:SMEK 2, suppressor of mek1 (Dictyostelium) n=1 Tax=Dermatophagoides farinae TaxID=6954 RepID=A0A922I048_DERFA|nr:SMEK 2, suppressor of mek1 (Dictyostelium) [Dermatophagoides farinae]
MSTDKEINKISTNEDDSDSQMSTSSSSSSSSSSSTSVTSSATNSSTDSINNNRQFSSSNSINDEDDDDGDADDDEDDVDEDDDTSSITTVPHVSESIAENLKASDDIERDDDLDSDVLICSEHQQEIGPKNESQPSTTTATSKTVSTTSTSNNNNNNIASSNKTSSDQSSTTTTESSSIFSNSNPTDTRRRVKLYMLNANRTWDDRGTGHVSSSYIDRLNGMSLLVRAETDGSTLLESKIMPDTAYQKQQDTLIVWSEGENYDLALSFQERIGCEEIWAKICQVQGKDPSVDITQDLIEDEDNELPPIEVNRLDEINSILTSSLTTASKKDNITLALENDNYILKLLELFRQLEERQDIPALQKIYEIFKNIFLLNKGTLIEIMISDQAICDVIGIFEYDPNGARVREYQAKTNNINIQQQQQRLSQQPSSSTSSSTTTQTPHTLSSQSQSYFTYLPSSSESELMRLVREKRHREFLQNVSRFKEVIPLSKSELVSKIHQTYRVQYIQDVIMPSPSIFEDNMLSTLSSLLFFNKIEIVTSIQDDEKFLKELFRQLSDTEPSFQEKRRDLVLFLKELCTFSHTLQNREFFIKTLSSSGLLQTIETLLICDDAAIKLGAVDLLTYVVDYSPSMVREYALQQEMNTDKPAEQYIINIIIEQMICDIDPDLGMAQQLSGILKMIIDPDNMLTTPALNKTEKSEFLNYFYKHCICYLTAPILAATASSATSLSLPPPTSTTNQLDLTLHNNHSNGQPTANVSLANHSNFSTTTTPSSTTTTSSVTNTTTILSNTEPLKLLFENSCQAAQLLAIILELLTFCIEHHAHHIRSYLINKEIIRRIMILTKSRHTFLVLTVIRFMRKLVGLKDEFYNRHIETLNQFQPIVDAFLSNRGRYNLLDSAVIDLFEFIDQNEIQTLLTYTIKRFWKNKLERIDYQHRSSNLSHPLLPWMRTATNAQSSPSTHHRFRRDPRQLDKEEDMWFNTDDDEEEEECPDDDDDDDDDIGVSSMNYPHHGVDHHHHHHHHSGEEEDDDLIPGSISVGSSPDSNQTSNVLGNHLALNSASAVLSAAAGGADPIDNAAAAAAAAHHLYVGKIGTSSNPGTVLHHHQHHLHISSLHSGTNTSSSGSSSSSSSSSYNSLTAATNSLYHHDSGAVSSAGTNSTAVAFVDSPFFSSLASVAAATSGATQTVSGTMGSGFRINKSNDRKLTINLNHKTTNYLTSASGSLSTQNTSNYTQQSQANQPKTSCNNVLSAFSSGLSFSSINSSIAAVAVAAAAGVQQSSQDTVTATSVTGTTTTANQQFRTNTTNMTNNSHPHQLSTMGQHIAAAAAAFHNLNNNNLTGKSTAETVLSRKALVDYPDEDSSDEDDSSEASDTQKEEENVEDEDDNDNDYSEEENVNDIKEEHPFIPHCPSNMNIRVQLNKATTSGDEDSTCIIKKHKEPKSCSKHHQHHCRSGSLKLAKNNPVVNNNNSGCSATVVHETSSISESKTNGSDKKSESLNNKINDERVSSSLQDEQSVAEDTTTSDDNNEKENLMVNRKRKSSEENNDDNDDDDDDDLEQDIDNDHQSNVATSKIEQLFNTGTGTESNTDSSSADSSSKRFRYSFVESDETHTEN